MKNIDLLRQRSDHTLVVWQARWKTPGHRRIVATAHTYGDPAEAVARALKKYPDGAYDVRWVSCTAEDWWGTYVDVKAGRWS